MGSPGWCDFDWILYVGGRLTIVNAEMGAPHPLLDKVECIGGLL